MCLQFRWAIICLTTQLQLINIIIVIVIVIVIIIIIIIIITSFMQGIYTHIPEINYVPRE